MAGLAVLSKLCSEYRSVSILTRMEVFAHGAEAEAGWAAGEGREGCRLGVVGRFLSFVPP